MGQEASNHKLVFLEGRDKAGVVLANDLDAIIDDLTDPRIFGEKKVDFDLEVLERAGESVDISRDSDRAREDLGDLGIGKGIGVPAQFQLFVSHVSLERGCPHSLLTMVSSGGRREAKALEDGPAGMQSG